MAGSVPSLRGVAPKDLLPTLSSAGVQREDALDMIMGFPVPPAEKLMMAIEILPDHVDAFDVLAPFVVTKLPRTSKTRQLFEGFAMSPFEDVEQKIQDIFTDPYRTAVLAMPIEQQRRALFQGLLQLKPSPDVRVRRKCRKRVGKRIFRCRNASRRNRQPSPQSKHLLMEVESVASEPSSESSGDDINSDNASNYGNVNERGPVDQRISEAGIANELLKACDTHGLGEELLMQRAVEARDALGDVTEETANLFVNISMTLAGVMLMRMHNCDEAVRTKGSQMDFILKMVRSLVDAIRHFPNSLSVEDSASACDCAAGFLRMMRARSEVAPTLALGHRFRLQLEPSPVLVEHLNEICLCRFSYGYANEAMATLQCALDNPSLEFPDRRWTLRLSLAQMQLLQGYGKQAAKTASLVLSAIPEAIDTEAVDLVIILLSQSQLGRGLGKGGQNRCDKAFGKLMEWMTKLSQSEDEDTEEHQEVNKLISDLLDHLPNEFANFDSLAGIFQAFEDATGGAATFVEWVRKRASDRVGTPRPSSIGDPFIDVISDKTIKNLARSLSCAFCGSRDKKLHLCSRCRWVRYCSVECQRTNWQSHKDACRIRSDSLEI